MVDADAGQIWTLVYNGADGDDWSRSNHGTEIALRHPLTPDRVQLVAELRSEYQDTDEAYRPAGVRGEHAGEVAVVLRELGIGADQVQAPSGLLVLDDAEDVTAFAAIPAAQWERAGWWERYGYGLGGAFEDLGTAPCLCAIRRACGNFCGRRWPAPRLFPGRVLPTKAAGTWCPIH